MKIPPSSDRKRAFIAVLKELTLCRDENLLNDKSVDEFISFFVTLYGKGTGYRHNYSNVCTIMYDLLKPDEELYWQELPREAEALANNVARIITAMKNKTRKHVQYESHCKNYDLAVKSLEKLHDHIELERIRLKYLIVQNKHLVNAAHKAQDASQKAQDASQKAQSEIT